MQTADFLSTYVILSGDHKQCLFRLIIVNVHTPVGLNITPGILNIAQASLNNALVSLFMVSSP